MVCPDVHGHLNLCLKGVRKKIIIRRMVRKKLWEEELKTLEFDSHQQHAASWETLPHPTPSRAFVAEKKQNNNLLSASK